MAEKKTTVKSSTKAKDPAVKEEKNVKAEAKSTAAKKSASAAKKTVKKAEKAAEKPAAKPEEKPVEKAAAKPAAKTAKKAAEKPAAKAPAKKTATKKTVKKAEAKKPAAKAQTKAAEVKQPIEKAEVSAEAKAAEAKAAEAKAAEAKKAAQAEKMAQYERFSLDSCIAMMQAMGVSYTYDDYARELMHESDPAVIVEKIKTDFRLEEDAFHYEEDGYDRDLTDVTVKKVADTMDFKASDFPKMADETAQACAYVLSDDLEKDGEEYLSEFHLWEHLLMIAQHRGIRNEEGMHEVVKADLMAFMKHFMTLARRVLPQWQYDDVKFYENFAYAILSQFEDLFAAYNNELMMDIADLYILHEDYGRGDADYGYIIRDNKIKDYVYYRFAHVYEDIDLDKAKGIAYDALQYVDGRYDYYQPIIDILNR